MKQIIVLIGLILCCHFLNAQQSFSGFIHDAVTGETLIGVSVFTANKKQGTATDAYGYFTMYVQKFDTLFFQYLGYQTTNVIVFDNDVEIIIKLQPQSQALKQAEVKAQKVQAEKMGMQAIDIKLLNQLPAMGGERDLVKAFQLMPGVKKGADGTATMLVRGGAQDQNLVLLDDAPVYNPTHLLGFFSLFNTDAVKEATMQSGGFSANYGGRLSSVIDVHTLDGNNQHFESNASVGLLASRLAVQGPIARGKGSFLVASRVSYINKLFNAIGKELPFYFYDFNVKANYAITENDRLFVSYYYGNDVLNDSKTDTGNTVKLNSKMGNQISSIRWNRTFKNKHLFSNLVLFSSRYSYDIFAALNTNTISVSSRIADLGLKYTINQSVNNKWVIKYGAEYIRHSFIPTTTILTGNFNDNIQPQSKQFNVMSESAVFVTTDYKFLENWYATLGVRGSFAQAKSATYANLEPRLQVSYQFNPDMQLALSYAKMSQYMFLISSSSTFLPTDLWYGVSSNIKPQHANIFSVGYTFTNKNYLTRIETYYKPMHNLVEYREGTTDFVNANIHEHVVQGKGKAYGMEWFNKYNRGKYMFMLGYTLSWSNRQFSELNNGQTFFARFDRRHDLNLVVSYDFSRQISFSSVWSYATGSRFTPVTGFFMMPSGNYNNIELLPIYTGRNAIQLSAAHKLDVNLVVKSKPTQQTKWECHVGAYNIYNQTQPYRIKMENNSNGTKSYKQVGLFGFIPSVAFQVKF